MTMRDYADQYFRTKKATDQAASEPPVRSSEFVSWRIVDTPRRPRRWKLVADFERDDNSWTNYFQSYEQAIVEWNRRMSRDNGAPANDKLTDAGTKTP